MFSTMGIFAVMASGVFGFFAPALADRIIANESGTWADVFMGKGRRNPRLRGEEEGRRIAFITSTILIIITSSFLLLPSSFFMVPAVWLFALAVLTDIKARLIPDILTFPLVLLGVAAAPTLPWIDGLGEALSAAGAGYVLASLMGILYYKKSDAAIGGGDIKLIAAGGLFLGITGLPVALSISAVFSYIMMRFKVFARNDIPLAPFFALGAIIWVLYFSLFA
jgi:leader peptidase (prepilin peptidase)/N-methyltransferase